MAGSSQDNFAGAFAALLVTAAIGAIFIVLAYFFRSYTILFPVFIALGTTLLGAAVVLVVDRLVPPASQRKVSLESHVQIYDEFERMLNRLEKGRPHTIRTINSFPPRPDTGEHWDSRVRQFLEANPQTQFIRVIFFQDTEDWHRRLATIKKHYSGLPNYLQFRSTAPPAMEMFLVDMDEVLISFGTPSGESAPITYGIKLRDPRLCEQLEAYHRIRLQGQLQRESV